MPERVSRSLPEAATARAIPKSSRTAPSGAMHHVLRLHVAVDDPVAVGVVQRVEQVVGQAEGVADREPAHPAQVLPQGGPST